MVCNFISSCLIISQLSNAFRVFVVENYRQISKTCLDNHNMKRQLILQWRSDLITMNTNVWNSLLIGMFCVCVSVCLWMLCKSVSVFLVLEIVLDTWPAVHSRSLEFIIEPLYKYCFLVTRCGQRFGKLYNL